MKRPPPALAMLKALRAGINKNHFFNFYYFYQKQNCLARGKS